MEHLGKALILWLHLHPTSAGVVTGLITFIESLAIIGFFIPGSVTLTAIGTLVGSGVIPAVDIFAWAITGAILGDGLSFIIGYRYYKTIRKVWPFKRYPGLLTKGEAFFTKHGGKGIFISRFVGAVRPLIPIIAGMLRVSPVKFLCVEVISGVLWAPIYMLPGILVGAASAQFAPEQTLRFILIILLVICIIWLIVWLSKLFIKLVINDWRNLCDIAWRLLRFHLHPIYILLSEHERPESSRPLSMFFFSVAFGVLFMITLLLTLFDNHWLLSLNTSLLTFFESFHSASGEQISIIMRSMLGQDIVILSTALLLAIYFILRRDWHALRLIVGLIILAGGTSMLLKHLFFYPAPNVTVQLQTNSSFPSTSILLSLILFGFTAFLVSHNNALWVKKLSYLLTVLLVGLTIFADLYLNVQWFSNILAALFFGGFLLCTIIIAYRRHERVNYYQPLVVFIIVLLSQVILGYWYFNQHHQLLEKNYQLKQWSYYLAADTWWNSAKPLLPIYRMNRLNKPVQILNVQWLGHIDPIANTLRNTGWHDAVQLSYLALKRQLKGEEMTLISPIPETFNGHKVTLTLIKTLDTEDHYIILRLWEADYFTEHQPYYVGNISYHLPVKHWLFTSREKCHFTYESAIYLLQKSLVNIWQAKTIVIHDAHDFKHHPCLGDDNILLLIKP
jgi:membrane protein DedA with SNARE-associated domain